jgi:hypothetical protein
VYAELLTRNDNVHNLQGKVAPEISGVSKLLACVGKTNELTYG